MKKFHDRLRYHPEDPEAGRTAGRSIDWKSNSWRCSLQPSWQGTASLWKDVKLYDWLVNYLEKWKSNCWYATGPVLNSYCASVLSSMLPYREEGNKEPPMPSAYTAPYYLSSLATSRRPHGPIRGH
jgi:hypothetical protein